MAIALGIVHAAPRTGRCARYNERGTAMAAASFRIGQIPVRIHATFFITAVFLTLGATPTLKNLLTWVSVVLVSVIIHELGHAAMGRRFGLAPEIDLHGMGGTTSWRGGRSLTTAQSVAVSLAGPAVGIVVGGALWLFTQSEAMQPTPLVQLIVSRAIFVNFWWGLFNLVPMFPLDGGNAVRTALVAAFKLPGARAAHVGSLVVAALLALAAWVLLRDWWVPLLCAMFAAQNWRALQALRAIDRPVPPPAPYGA
jgi:Zn-dependent protease